MEGNNLDDINRLILDSMVNTNDKGMVFNTSFVKRDLDTLKHLAATINNKSGGVDASKLIENIRFQVI